MWERGAFSPPPRLGGVSPHPNDLGSLNENFECVGLAIQPGFLNHKKTFGGKNLWARPERRVGPSAQPTALIERIPNTIQGILGRVIFPPHSFRRWRRVGPRE